MSLSGPPRDIRGRDGRWVRPIPSDPVAEVPDQWRDVLLSVSRSLWDVVTPGLRYVSVGVVDGTILARFAYEDPPSDAEHEFVSLSETSVIADFYDILGTDFQAVHRPMTAPRVWEEGTRWWAYLRYEPDGA